jgi:hypothetical protein
MELKSYLSVRPSVAFAIVSGLSETVQQEVAHLPGWMVSAIADPW